MLVARRFVISGRVQGVGFRYFTQDWALREGATGWVRNLPDGRVEAHVEGEAESVTRIERALRTGPRGARVVCETEGCTCASSSSSALTRLDLPAPLGAATTKRLPG